MESLNDRRMRFQVNRVDSVVSGHHRDEHSPSPESDQQQQPKPIGRARKPSSSYQCRTPSISEVGENEEAGRAGSPTMLISPQNNYSTEHSTLYDTKYAKSFRHFTREALPRMDNYRNVMSIQAAYRPTLDELHDVTLHEKAQATSDLSGDQQGTPASKEGAVKFGWIKGVFVRCLLNIWGVMLFLRLSWVVGQAGIGQAWVIILLATAVTLITALSMSAISTNGQIKGGGTYYMISRSLGPEFGASIGLIFAVANAVAVAMYTVGFAESLNDLLKSVDAKIIDNSTNDIRIVGSIAIVLLTCIVVVGMEWEATAQIGLLFILLVAIVDFMIGSFIGPLDDEEKSRGFVGFNSELIAENFQPDYRYSEGVEHNFFSVFSIFFPAATGILAGANISGDLADPSESIPKGTLAAIVVTTLSYLLFAFIAGGVAVRDASGIIDEVGNGTFLNCTQSFRKCDWGLQNNFQVMELVSAWGPLIYAGCFAATLSSALASLVSAPKVFQALCNDRLYPYIHVFGKGYGKNNEPVRGYVLTFFIALAFILIAELNAIAPLISNFFLAAYALVNFSTFHASLVKPVGWRPTFKYYNMWLSLVGFVLCVAVMFLISWWTALLTFTAIFFLYLLVIYRKPDVNWGSTTQAQTYKSALASVQQLNNIEDHVKNYRPQILVLTGFPSSRPPLLDFAYAITKNLALLVTGHILQSPVPSRLRSGLVAKASRYLRRHKVKGFYTLVDDCNFEDGARALLQASGIGKMKPNILLMGYKSDWRTCHRQELRHYFNVIHKAMDLHFAVAILRVQEGLDYSKVIADEEDETSYYPGDANGGLTSAPSASQESLPRNPSLSQLSQASSNEFTPPGTPCTERASDRIIAENPKTEEDSVVMHNETNHSEKKSKKKKDTDNKHYYRGIGGVDLSPDVISRIVQFQQKQKKATIDVWWLYDDGGLTLLLPFVISTRSFWSGCKLRVFALANKKDDFDIEHRSMAGLLAKFRIDYSDLKIITDITKKPQESTRTFFQSLVDEFRHVQNVDEDDSDIVVSEAELLAMRDKTNRHLRLREMLQEHSKNSSLVVMTLPMPRKGAVSAPLYMAWLELLTKDMPPFLLVRGNQQSVLTFYS